MNKKCLLLSRDTHFPEAKLGILVVALVGGDGGDQIHLLRMESIIFHKHVVW